jgi:hypothetical protein
MTTGQRTRTDLRIKAGISTAQVSRAKNTKQDLSSRQKEKKKNSRKKSKIPSKKIFLAISC